MFDDFFNILKSPTFWGVAIPFASAIIMWFINEVSKRRWESYKRREERYINLVNFLEGFYSRTEDVKKKYAFIQELRLCWLYAPDEVILAANNFLITCKNNTKATQEEQDKSVGKLIIEIRKDLRNTRNSLLEKDFLHWRAD